MCMCVHVCVIPVNWRKLTATSAYVQDDSLLFLLPPVLGPDSPPSPTCSSAFNLHCSSTSRQIQPPFSLTSSLCGLHHILGNDTTLPPSSPVLSLKGICSAANQLCLSEKLSVEPKLLPSFPISTVPGGLKATETYSQPGGFKTADIYCLTVLEAGTQKLTCQQGHALQHLWRLQGRLIPCCFQPLVITVGPWSTASSLQTLRLSSPAVGPAPPCLHAASSSVCVSVSKCPSSSKKNSSIGLGLTLMISF